MSTAGYKVCVRVFTAETVISKLDEIHASTSVCVCEAHEHQQCVPASVAIVNRLKVVRYFYFPVFVSLL